MANPNGTTGRVNTWKALRAALVVEEGFNARFDMGDLDLLADSIATHGVKRALNVQRADDPEKFVVRDGHRRLAAIDLAIASGKVDPASFEIPLVIEDKAATKADMLVLMAIANDGKPLLPLEEARIYKGLRDEGHTILEICKLVSRGDVHVRDRLALLEAAPAVQDALKSGTLGSTLAQQIVNFAKKDHTKQAELVAKATSGDKAAVRQAVDGEQRKKVAAKMKVTEIQQDLDATVERLTARLEKAGLTMKAIREQVTPEIFEIAKLIGAKTALQKLVNAATADE